MDSLNISNIKLEKANAIKKHRQLQKIANLFRFIEICIVIALISRFSIRLPVAVKNSSEYFKDLSVILVSPRFVFILGNAIVITLFAKSGQFSSQDTAGKNYRTDFYDEFVEKSERIQGMRRNEAGNRQKQSTYQENRGKQSTCGENRGKQSNFEENRAKQSICEENRVTEETCVALERKNYQRSQSEKLQRANRNKSFKDLRRSATVKSRGSVDSTEGLVRISYPEDNMSNEEFRCTVEAFIARQKRFLREEEISEF